MIYDDSMCTKPLPNSAQESEQDSDQHVALKDLKKLCGIFKQSGMTEELIRDRHEEHRKEEEKWK
jgi:hypothetical protein